MDNRKMKQKFRKLSVVLTGLIVLYGLSGCITSSAANSVNPTDTNTVTVSSASPTLSPSATSTSTQTPTLIPPTPTAISTLNSQDASAEILRLLSSPDETCLFQCWWGLTPGQTRMADAQNYLDSFSFYSGMRGFDNQKGSVLLVIPQEQDSHLDIDFQYGGKDGILEWLRVGIWRNIKVNHSNGESSYEISWGDPKLTELTKPYSLSRVLTTYGAPADVLIFTRQATLLNQPWPISLVLFYPEHGFMIEYVADDRPVIKRPGVTWCQSLAFPYFWFWSPEQEITIKDVISWIDGYQLSYDSVASGRFKTLEHATDMNIDELYSLFTSDEDACITTPAELWPMPGE
jgi:hypothetical protein